MAVQKGSALLFAVDVGAGYVTVGGDQNGEISYEDAAGEFTNKGSTGLWREVMDGGTVRGLSFSFSGADLDDATLQSVVGSLFGASTRHIDGRVTMPGFGAVVCDWHVSSFNNSGQLNEPSALQFQLMSAGAPTFTPS